MDYGYDQYGTLGGYSNPSGYGGAAGADGLNPQVLSSLLGMANPVLGGAFGLAQGYFNNQSQQRQNEGQSELPVDGVGDETAQHVHLPVGKVQHVHQGEDQGEP